MSTSAEVSANAGRSVESSELVKGLGLTSATTLVMGSMIGSGIFIVSADIARLTGSPALLIAAWAITGFLTIVGALSYGELAAMMPKAGGQYIYLREALGPMWGFLYGWTLFLVIQTGTIAAVGVAFGKFLGYFFPGVAGDRWILGPVHIGVWNVFGIPLGNMDMGLNTQNLAGIVIIVLLTVINTFGIKTGALVQNIFTIAKISALALLVLAGIVVGRNPQAVAANFTNFWRNASLGSLHQIQPGVWITTLTALAVAQTGSLFSADAWNNVTFTAGEVKNPKRNLPLSLALGTGVVIFLYIAANFIYLNVLPLEGSASGATEMARGIQYATSDRVGTAVMQQMFGSHGAALMAIAIMISTFGCCNGLILSGARVYYAMAKDGLFFKSTGVLNAKSHAPRNALIVQGIWTCLLCLSGSYGQLLDYIIFAVLVFYILTIAGLFVLRRTEPNAERPYRAIGYPILPGIYIVMALFIDVVLLRYKPQYTWPGLFIVLLGIPVYLVWSRRSATATA
ncbi:MAG TPA: amino acid permease [Candidatus Angelobacter sp.]|jgi:APA family basic amino acid/polyamine antiporter|nr:amino acid permease [Candidatus Angelobacter sp.]